MLFPFNLVLACAAGVARVLKLVELGYSIDRIVEEYPHLSRDVVTEMLKLAKRMHEVVSYHKVKMLIEAGR
ncbi:MAG: hypothetical protein AOA65_1652 [Candidatus Bathyarchaeota archaeon BA1]|nr:MAG: hypothetical protein AOA65_1652 [Candidatus Bathyarchaeota archaeon BA1]